MDDRFDRCLAALLGYEGGFVNNPRDPGGATNFGVTRATWSNWIGHTATIDEIEALTPEQVAPLYRGRYWLVAACDRLPVGPDLMMFDMAVNQGVAFASRTLQQATGCVVDGIVGSRTLAVAQTDDRSRLVNMISALRRQRYVSLPTFDVFGKGWLSRLGAVTALALADAAT